MALTPEQIDALKEQAVAAWYEAGYKPILQVFVARVIEAEVRKQDEVLIRQMLEALTACRANGAIEGFVFDMATGAIKAARARLEEKP